MNPHFPFDGELGEVMDLYLLDALEPGERTEVAAHQTRGCEVCVRELAAARTRSAVWALLAAQTEPGPALKARILHAIAPPAAQAAQKRGAHFAGWSWSWGPLAVVLGLVFLVVYGRMIGLQERAQMLQAQIGEAQSQMRAALEESQQLRLAAELVAAPGTQAVAVKASPATPQGQAYLNPSRGAVLIVSNLAPAAPQHTYEMWLLPAKGNPIPAGLFQTGSAGSAVHFFAQAWNSKSKAAIAGLAVSLEPSGGSPQPTGAIVLAAKVPAVSP